MLKDRTNVTKVGDVMENITYDIWKDYFDGMSGLKANTANYSEDIKKSTESMMDKADKAEDLANELKTLLKNVSSQADKNKVLTMIKDKEINVKQMQQANPEDLQEIIDFIKSLI